MTHRQNVNLSFVEDDYLRELYFEKPRLVIKLNTGETIYDDDERPGRDPASFWIRLKDFLDKREFVKIDEILLQFRSNVISPLPKKSKGYFFRKGLLANISGEGRWNFWCLGYVDSNKLIISKYYIPSLTLMESEERDINEENGRTIIWNKIK